MAKKKPARKPAKRKTSAKKTTRKTKKKATRKTATKKKATRRPATKKKAKKKVARKPAASKKTKKKVARKSTSRKKTAKKTTRKKRKPNAAFMAPLQPDAALSQVVGSKPLARTEVVKKLWKYIKKNDLQHAVNRRMIVADAKLKQVFNGKKQVDMFQMTKLISGHLQ